MDYQFYTTPAGGFTETQDTTNSVLSFLEGKYETNTPTNIVVGCSSNLSSLLLLT